jgi:hypothetical protein
VIMAPNSGNNFTTNVVPQTLTGTCSNDAVISANMGTVTDNCAGSGAWSLAVTLAVDSPNTITVTATDGASNTVSDSMTITHDGIAPAVAITLPNSGNDFTTNMVTQTLWGTCSNDSTVSANMGTVSDNCAALGNWMLGVTLAANTANTITVTATDAASNTASDSMTITHDTIAPVITNAVTMDADGNGRIDHYKITFDNPVNDSSFIMGNWSIGSGAYTITGLVSGGLVTTGETDIVNDNVIYIIFTQMSFPDTGAIPDITAFAGGIKDLAGNSLGVVNTASVLEKDGAKPRIESVVGAAGSDRITVTFTEPVDSSPGQTCTGTFSGIGYNNNSGGDASNPAGGWIDGNACDDSTIVFRTDVAVSAADIDVDGVVPPVSNVYDNSDNLADSSQYILRGMINSVKFRFNTTSNGANVPNDVTDFPVLIRITDPTIIDATQANANDIRFVDPIADGGKVLPYQIERWDQTNDVAEVWVLVPTVNGNSDTDYIMMYYNDKTNGTVPGRQEPGKVFSLGAGDSFAGVWHMSDGDAAVIQDSTANKNNSIVHTSTIFTGTPILGPSAIGPSQSFDGTGITYIQFEDNAVNNGDALDGTASGGLTVSAWVKPYNGNFPTPQSIVDKQGITAAPDGYQLLTQTSTENITLKANNPDMISDTLGGSTIQTDWYYFVAYINSGTGYLYFNGVDTSPITISGFPQVFANETPLTLGRQGDGIYPFRGYMDEVRIENTFRGPDWIKLSYENQRPNQTLVSSWYNEAWSNRIKITVNKSLISSSGIDQFPVYVDLFNMPAAFFSNMHYANGDDILVTAGDGITRLPRELVSYNAGGTGELWFKAPSLSVSYNTNFYIYYNSTSIETDDAASVWSNGYVGVWHMEDLTCKDSTGKHTPTLFGTLTSVPGIIGNGIQFNMVSHIQLTDGGSVTWGDTVRITAWFTPSSDASGDMPIVSKTDNSTGGFEMIVNPSLDQIKLGTYPNLGNQAIANGSAPNPFTINAGTSKLYCAAAVNNYAYIFYDGINVADVTTIDPASSTATDLYIGKYATSAGYLYGTLDEVRIHNVNMGNGWQITEMNNMRLQTSFIIISSPENK